MLLLGKGVFEGNHEFYDDEKLSIIGWIYNPRENSFCEGYLIKQDNVQQLDLAPFMEYSRIFNPGGHLYGSSHLAGCFRLLDISEAKKLWNKSSNEIQWKK